MSRPITRAQAVENRRFLHELARTGNVREAARRIGRAYSTMQHRRAAHPDFAQRWDAALTIAQARLGRAGLSGPTRHGAGAGPGAHRTGGGEPVVVRRNDGTPQVRRAQPGKLTTQCEQAFLLALSATANIKLSAQAAGASEAAFHRRRRNNPEFALQVREALARGHERIELALLASATPDSFANDAWRHNEPPALPPMTAEQALQVLWHHTRTVLWGELPRSLRRRRGECRETYEMRLHALHEARKQAGRDRYTIAQAERRAEHGLAAGEAEIVLAAFKP